MSEPDECSDPGADLIPGYCPYIADVSIEDKSTPFPKQNQPQLSQEEIDKKKKKLKKYIQADKFRNPIPLKDYLLIAKDRWALENEEEEESKCGPSICNIE